MPEAAKTAPYHRARVKHGLAAAEQTGADLIVIGHRGLSWMEGMLVGSTPERVAGIANTPVLIVQQDTTRSA